MNNNDNIIELSKVYNRKKTDQDIFQELMLVKVTEVLFIGTYYDSLTQLFAKVVFSTGLWANIYNSIFFRRRA